MTVKLSISVPGDVAAFLQAQGNASAAVTEAVRQVPPRLGAHANAVPPWPTGNTYGSALRIKPAQTPP
ncbi:hypothetical protein Ahu01nite_007910 [Winogradskya humida]|uniref:Uncharacterized protein n=1 Tax=Winogradskya humida TaxID=113566 RepID=A0ABQ3ZGI8_9ACTN|nr:hypothetical protein Ahu01nite_007910 [Actinoplanes humidus]